ncbi:MAG: hypothetical protein GXP42_13310 [Chloroflexi bacterium]|nr:hypothetical protein [Chloroflexota bacterium]
MSQRAFLILSWLFAALAGAGLVMLIWRFPPVDGLVALALLLLFLAIAAGSAPIWYRVQQRWSPKTATGSLPYIATRQGVWTGLFVSMVIFLRIFRLLDWVLVFVLFTLLVMTEVFLQQRRQLREIRKSSTKTVRRSRSSAPTYQRAKSASRKRSVKKK